MKALEDKILKDGIVLNNEILKVDSFVNHQIDSKLLVEISKDIKNHFNNVDKIVTIEISGIAFAVCVGIEYGGLPVVFAKKTISRTLDVANSYVAEVKSFTKGTLNQIRIDKKFLTKGERILIIDDFLASGNAAIGLIEILKQAGCEIVGVSAIIEKRFQGGRKRLEDLGVEVYCPASIDSFADGKPVFHKD
jgi:xanthine phosphoribosyltransferase